MIIKILKGEKILKKLKNYTLILALMGTTLVLSACNEQPSENNVEKTDEVEDVQENVNESEASQYLSGKSFDKHIGDGADRLVFVDDHTLIISVEDTLPPYISNLDDIEDFEEGEIIEFENIELMDSDSEEYLVIYDGEELLKLMINEDDLLEAEDGTTYMQN